MSSPDIEATLKQYLVDELGLPASLSNDDRLAENGFLASAQLIDIVTFVEDNFGVVLRPTDVTPEALESVSTIAAAVRNRQAR